jgi:hypothetical protein
VRAIFPRAHQNAPQSSSLGTLDLLQCKLPWPHFFTLLAALTSRKSLPRKAFAANNRPAVLYANLVYQCGTQLADEWT